MTGRCVDSAVTLGALMHEFGWAADDFDRLAQGSLAGHIIECGCQATGGLHTDWESVPDWAHIGYPVVECHADGSFVATKPPGTGGLVNTAVIAEQMLYEIGDPRRYLLPDVTCDFSGVRLEQQGENRVLVQGARGLRARPGLQGLSHLHGRLSLQRPADHRRPRCGTQGQAHRRGHPGTHARSVRAARPGRFLAHADRGARVASKPTTVRRRGPATCARPSCASPPCTPQKAALELFAREIAPAGTSWSPGTTGADGRPRPSPAIKQFAFLLDKDRVTPQVAIEGQVLAVTVPAGQAPVPPAKGEAIAQPPPAAGPLVEVPLVRLAWARSGDKGDNSNIGVIARKPEWLPLLREQLTEARVGQWLAHLVQGSVTRYDVPGIHAMNFLCTRALDGGGMASLRNDPLGKGMAQILLSIPVQVPAGWSL